MSEPAGMAEAATLAGLVAGTRPGFPGRRRLFVHPLPDPVAIRVRAIPDTAPPLDEGQPDPPPDEGVPGPPPGEGVPDDHEPARAARHEVDAFAAVIAAALDREVAADARGRGQVDGPATGARAGGVDGPAETGRSGGAAGTGWANGSAETDTSDGGGGSNGTARAAGAAGTAGRLPGPVWPSRFAQVLAETLAGSRPPAQLVPWTTERARRHIRRLGPMLVGGQQPVVRRVVTSRPTAGVMEVSVVVGVGPRVRALALRLEQERSQPAAPGRPGRTARWVCTAVEAA